MLLIENRMVIILENNVPKQGLNRAISFSGGGEKVSVVHYYVQADNN
jgi:hypothetical protein